MEKRIMKILNTNEYIEMNEEVWNETEWKYAKQNDIFVIFEDGEQLTVDKKYSVFVAVEDASIKDKEGEEDVWGVEADRFETVDDAIEFVKNKYCEN